MKKIKKTLILNKLIISKLTNPTSIMGGGSDIAATCNTLRTIDPFDQKCLDNNLLTHAEC
jgi:hypothetical protein